MFDPLTDRYYRHLGADELDAKLTENECAACGSGFTQSEWDDRHWSITGEEVHARCCDSPRCADIDRDSLNGLGSVPTSGVGPPYPAGVAVLAESFNRYNNRRGSDPVAWTLSSTDQPDPDDGTPFKLGDTGSVWLSAPDPNLDITSSLPFDLDVLQRQVGEWTAGQWPDESMHGRGLILTEELCELEDVLGQLRHANGQICRAILKRNHGERGTHEQWSAKIREECADVLCVLLDIAHREGFSLAETTAAQAREVQARDRDHDPIEGP